MSTKIQQQIEWRRAKVMELLSKDKNNQSEMQVYCKLTNLLCAETQHIRQQAKANTKKYIDELLSRVQIKFYQL